MKKFLILSLISLLTSCHLGRKQYIYIEIAKSPTRGLVEKEPEVFYEKDDSLAYDWACDRYDVSVSIYTSMDGMNIQQAAQKPVSFVVLNESNRRIYRGDNSVAFKTSLFGMSKDAVESLNLFNGNHAKLRVGEEEYSVEMGYTPSDSLYWVGLMSASYHWTEYYDKVRPLAEEMLDYLKKDYGYPTHVNEMPSRKAVENADSIIPIYVWDMREKYVVVAMDCYEQQGYPVFHITTRIINKKLWLSLFNNDIESAEKAYWSKAGRYEPIFYKFRVELKKIDGTW